LSELYRRTIERQTHYLKTQCSSIEENSDQYYRCRRESTEVVQDLWPLGTHIPLPLSPNSTALSNASSHIATHKPRQESPEQRTKSKHEGATPKCTLTLPLHNLHDGKTQPCLPRMRQRHRDKILVVVKRRRHGSTSALRYHFTTKSAWVACESCRIASKGKSRVGEQEWKTDGLKCDEE
jgi:hypothetical protein